MDDPKRWIKSQAWREFQKTHSDSNGNDLLLRYSGKSNQERFFASQLASRKKAAGKFPEPFFTDEIIFPSVVSIAQTSSSMTALYKKGLVSSGNIGADITGGFGIDTFFLSKSFDTYFHIERNEALAEIVRHNFEVMGLSNIEVLHDDAVLWLKKRTTPLDFIMVDPDRRQHGRRVFALSDCAPNIEEVANLFSHKANHWLVKVSPMLDITALSAALPAFQKCHILEMNGDCRELLMEKLPNTDKPLTIHVARLENSVWTKWIMPNATDQKCLYGKPSGYLYEPFPAVMKSGLYDQFALKFKLNKIHPATHLYYSEAYKSDFPGNIYQIKKIIAIKKVLIPKTLHRIVSRNFPLSSDQIRKKFKIAYGGSQVLFACKFFDESYQGVLGVDLNSRNGIET
jgi:hypothetical protein